MRRMDIVPLSERLSDAEVQISEKVDLSVLTGYYAKSETSSAAEISTALESIEPPDPVFLSSTTYAELTGSREVSGLVPGMCYRIIDYVASTSQLSTSAV
jgi:hypothetical protein